MNVHVLRAALLSLTMVVLTVPARAITIPTVPIGNPGNPNDPADGDSFTDGVQNYGGVGYAYNIGKYEVTVGEYTAFLNAVAATDTYDLYTPAGFFVAEIERSGSSGSFTYSVIGLANHPVTKVSWADAARFANWLHNGQPTGAQDATTTEDGAYFLNGANSEAALSAVARKAGATWFIPTENEWYKAAYHQPAAQGGDSDGYWAYPMKTNSEPYSDQPPGATPDNARVGNFYKDDALVNGYNDGYAVTGSTIEDQSQIYLTDVGAYTSSPSHYGTFDQGGNVIEFNETLGPGSYRVGRGGSWGAGSVGLSHASFRGTGPALNESFLLGFRVASVPEPSTLLLTVLAGSGLLWRRRGLRGAALPATACGPKRRC